MDFWFSFLVIYKNVADTLLRFIMVSGYNVYIFFKILFIGFIFFIAILQAIFIALFLNSFNRFFSIMKQIELSSASVTTWGRCFLGSSLIVVFAVQNWPTWLVSKWK